MDAGAELGLLRPHTPEDTFSHGTANVKYAKCMCSWDKTFQVCETVLHAIWLHGRWVLIHLDDLKHFPIIYLCDVSVAIALSQNGLSSHILHT